MCTIHDDEQEVTGVVLNVEYVPKDWNLNVTLPHSAVVLGDVEVAG